MWDWAALSKAIVAVMGNDGSASNKVQYMWDNIPVEARRDVRVREPNSVAETIANHLTNDTSIFDLKTALSQLQPITVEFVSVSAEYMDHLGIDADAQKLVRNCEKRGGKNAMDVMIYLDCMQGRTNIDNPSAFVAKYVSSLRRDSSRPAPPPVPADFPPLKKPAAWTPTEEQKPPAVEDAKILQKLRTLNQMEAGRLLSPQAIQRARDQLMADFLS